MLNPYSWLAIYLGVGAIIIFGGWKEFGKPAFDELVGKFPTIPELALAGITALTASLVIIVWPAFMVLVIVLVIRQVRREKK